MSPMATAGIVLACVFGGALLGMALRGVLPDHHRSAESRDLVKLGMGLIATMSALLLGLLIASAKGSYDEQKGELTQMTSRLIFLDRVLAHYGPETQEIRGLLRGAAAQIIDELWPKAQTASRPLTSAATGSIYDRIQELSPKTEVQRSIQTQAASMAIELGQMRWLMFEQRGRSVSTALLVVVVFWLTIIFASFGLFAPSNATVTVTLFVCALSVSCAIFLILEMDRPFEGILQISGVPLRDALAHLGQ